MLNRPAEPLEVGDHGYDSRLRVLRARNGSQGTPIGIAVEQFVRDLNEEAAFSRSLGVDGDGCANVTPRLDIFARLRRYGQMDGRMGEGARLGTGKEVLNQGAEAVEFVGGGVPAEQGFARGGFQRQGEHVLLVFHVDLDLILFLCVRDGEGRSDFDLGAIFRPGAYQGADDSGGWGVFGYISSRGVIKNGEDSL